eukprot:CAMPEP_0118969118 /NCGR_PEP_ID=MMETSP1173-20130426/6248_1 /TAXON_ID=1034831 /ORGANISM="Rhizochromulina marina cf, Strain CCMP1243" /LENGTH=57 /DNA_ID=CAMNT_0006918317 /DNA_START=292 /DNA_END=465 /DNA_ORIENTATION=+
MGSAPTSSRSAPGWQVNAKEGNHASIGKCFGECGKAARRRKRLRIQTPKEDDVWVEI